MAYINTVLGKIDIKNLGFTYTHEHLLAHPPEWKRKEDPDLELPSIECAIIELKKFYNAGGRTLVEGSTIDYGREPERLKIIATQVPINIVCSTGFNKASYYPVWVKEIEFNDLVDLFVKEIEEGIGNTGIKAGQIKIGTSYNVITTTEEKVAAAAAKAQNITKAPIWCHTENGTMGIELLDILEKNGADISKVAIGHSDRNADYKYHLDILKRGAYLQFDGPGKIKYYPDSTRIELIKRIINNGFENKLLISGDMGRKSYLSAYGGGPGFEYIIKKFTKRMLEEGIEQKIINKIFIENPANWLQIEKD
ncbi:phosphotriesterase family protein [Tepidanaerobacter syntrophicus]|uniref:phosphotriesterase family protein n=1 Tax=Tepidanaerobacter syntrophicus TaxID=224999 RepID=UPI001768AC89|nr:phosphotriesterase-related protein [Tepidanaerobacter syntrophicus]HHV82282.1 phosphotriesterase-related protein [Tepidanaerobacter syntrophicus]